MDSFAGNDVVTKTLYVDSFSFVSQRILTFISKILGCHKKDSVFQSLLFHADFGKRYESEANDYVLEFLDISNPKRYEITHHLKIYNTLIDLVINYSQLLYTEHDSTELDDLCNFLLYTRDRLSNLRISVIRSLNQ